MVTKFYLARFRFGITILSIVQGEGEFALTSEAISDGRSCLNKEFCFRRSKFSSRQNRNFKVVDRALRFWIDGVVETIFNKFKTYFLLRSFLNKVQLRLNGEYRTDGKVVPYPYREPGDRLGIVVPVNSCAIKTVRGNR